MDNMGNVGKFERCFGASRKIAQHSKGAIIWALF